MAYTATARDLPADYNDPNVFHLNAKQGDEHSERRPEETFLGYRNRSGHGLPVKADGHRLDSLRFGRLVIDDFGRDRTDDARGDFLPVFAHTEELNAARA